METIAATTTSTMEPATTASCMCNFLNDPSQLPTIKYNLRSHPTNLINLEKNVFSWDRYGVERPEAAARTAKSRNVNRIVNSLVNTILKEKFSYKHTPEQIILALNGAFKHPKLQLFLKSAGVVDVKKLEAMKYNHQQIDCILMQTNTSKKKIAWYE